VSHSRKRRGRRRANPITLRHDGDTTTLDDRRFGRVTIPGYWPNLAEFRKALDRLPNDMKKCEWHN
jgi:hypothetical protein